ncbi:MAG: FadR/GntR family transcriptional regulator [Cellvibrio sp.]|jgi:DNA-binding FadR family transcriptional regulator
MSARRLYQQVVVEIMELINSGEYPPGSRLPPERELAERFNVSRLTIREAVIALEVKELVKVKTGSGVYVADRKQIQGDANIGPFELTQARAIFEGEAAALAALMINDAELAELEETLNLMDQENSEGDLTSQVADRKFHLIISRATRNAAILSTIQQLWNIRENSAEIRRAYDGVCKIGAEHRLEEHRAIFEAIKNRDSNAARKAMHLHFTRIIDALLKVTEAEALEATRIQLNKSREQFSLAHLIN